MSDKVIAGADFTGTKENPNETWLVVGRLSNVGFEILEVKKTGSHLLVKDLAAHKTLSSLGVNCPLSFPAKFLDFFAGKKLKKSYQAWQEVVEDLVFTPYDELVAIAKEYGKEPKRVTDTAGGATAASPLKRANPPMLHQTYHGMRVLASLDPGRCFVLPFQDPIPFGIAVMEVHPHDTVQYLGLTHIEYKNNDKVDVKISESQREKMVQSLTKIKERKAISFKDFPPLVVQKQFLHNFVHCDRAVDALIACYTTAMFAFAPQHFDDPFSADALEVLLEGWTYRVK